MENISKRENYLRAVRRQSPQWVPMDFQLHPEMKPIVAQHLGTDDVAEYFDFDVRWADPRQPAPPWHLGEKATPADVDALPWHELSMPEQYAHMPVQVAAFKARGYATMAGGCNFQEEFAGLLGFERLLLEMAGNTPLVHRLFERLGEANVRTAEHVTRSGADILSSSGDIATQRGPLLGIPMWREFMYPIMKEAYMAARRINPDILIFYHSCGNVMDFIPALIEAGVDILDPCQPEALDIVEAKRRYGDDICFHGGIGVQTTLRNGTPQDVRETVKRTLDVMAENGGYICAPAHEVLPEIPVKNLLTFVETVREYGG